MRFQEKINFSVGVGAKVPHILQTEAAECGLACLGMLAGYHGHHTDLASLRARFPVSLKGMTLGHLIRIGAQLELGSRPLQLEMHELNQLKLPCILHWNFNHFVVLTKVGADSVVLVDPAIGERSLSIEEVSKSFTGVALEVWPNPQFQRQERKPTIKLRALMGHVTGLWRSFGQILLLALALEVFTLVSPLFLQLVIDRAVANADRSLLTTLAIGFGMLMVLQHSVAAIRSWAIMYMGTTLSVQWRANVFSHLLRLPIQYFEKRHLGDVVSRFGAIDQIQRTLTTSFLEALLDGLMTLITLGMMFMYSATLGLVAVGAMTLYALSRWVWYRPLRKATEEQIIRAAKQQSHFLETVRGVKAIKLFDRQDERRSSWLSLLVAQINAELQTQKLHLLNRMINGVLFGAENILVIWLGALLVMDGKFTVGALIAFNAYRFQFDSRVSSLIDKYFEVKMLQLQGERLADIVLGEPEPHAGLSARGEAGALGTSISVRDVHYRYGEQEPWVLDGVNMDIPAGQSVAIVGPSGCGKTTLMNVLLGILPLEHGEILVGGVNLKTAGPFTLRGMVGTVLQDDVLFAGSIAQNISFFDNAPDMAWIEQCARSAAVAAEIAQMSMGYDTLVGDMGTVLSGGQKQRILLARALYKRPRILFLDEATSHLDIAKELEVNRAIKELHITRIVIAHRPETIASAERVIELDGGVVVRDYLLDGEPIHKRA